MSPLPPEDELVERLRSLFATRRRDVRVGIGDDAAVLTAPPEVAVSTDVLVEGEDFTDRTDPYLLGRKALSVNLSDLAAMGALPLHALLALGLPRDTDLDWIDSFAEGFRSAAREHGVAVVGGDLTAAPVRFAAVTVVGRVAAGGPLRRSGGRAGDTLFVSGTLGAAGAGLALSGLGFRLGRDGSVSTPPRRRVPQGKEAEVARLLRHQVNPRPAVELGRALAEGKVASAAIDLSDGLARDLHRLCRASGTGARLDASALPVDTALAPLAKLTSADPLDLALYGGEDFGLLFAVPSARMPQMTRISGRWPVRPIGHLDDTGRVALARDGRVEPVRDAGFDHFGPDRP